MEPLVLISIHSLDIKVLLRLEFHVRHPILMTTLATDQKSNDHISLIHISADKKCQFLTFKDNICY